MPDKFSKSKRSEIMSSIRSKNTKPELFLKDKLKRFEYQPKVFGNPDFINWKEKIVLFVDGCFWHKCPIHSRIPKSNIKYWKPKLERNLTRAMEVEIAYKADGWKVVRIWEHDVNSKGLKSFLQKVIS